MSHPTVCGDYYRLGEVLRPGLRLARGPALRVRRRLRAAPPAPLADYAGPAPELVEFGGGSPWQVVRHTEELETC